MGFDGFPEKVTRIINRALDLMPDATATRIEGELKRGVALFLNSPTTDPDCVIYQERLLRWELRAMSSLQEAIQGCAGFEAQQLLQDLADVSEVLSLELMVRG